MSKMLRGLSLVIKSIQRGSIAITGAATNTATITSVDTTNSRLVYLGITSDNVGLNDENDAILLTFTNATTITATVTTALGAQTVTVGFEVIEYYPGVLKSVQRGTIAVAGAFTNTAAITSVDTTKSHVDFLGQKSTLVSQSPGDGCRVTLTNATTVTATRGTNSADTTTVGFQVVEFN